MPSLNRKKLKKLLFALFIVGVFCFSLADFTCAKTKQEWLSEINQLLTDPNSDVIKDKEQWLSELEQVAKEETDKRVVEIECIKNPETCPLPLNPLAINENGNIEGVNLTPDVSSSTSGVGIFIEKLKQALVSLGLTIENGIVQARELIAEKITATKRIIAPVGQFEKIEIERMEIRDKITGETYCTWLENGEWVKVKSSCEEISNSNPSTSSGQADQNSNNQNAGGQDICDAAHLNLCTTQAECETVAGFWHNETCNIDRGSPPVSCTPDWSCPDWQPLPEIIACGQAFTQTRTCADSNNCGTAEGKPIESQDATGILCSAPNATGTCQTGTCAFTCNEGWLDCNGDGTGSDTDGCEYQKETSTSTCPSTGQ